MASVQPDAGEDDAAGSGVRGRGPAPAGRGGRRGGWQASVDRLAAGLEAGLAPARGRPGVADVRVLGAIGVVQLTGEVDVAAATAAAVRAGVWLRPFRDLIYTMPPYVTSDEDLALICRGVLAAVEAAS